MKSIHCPASRVAFLAVALVASACHIRIEHYGAAALELEGKAERTIEVDLPLSPGQTLAVATRHGDVRASANTDRSGSRATVKLTMRARTDEEAAQVLARYEVRTETTANGLALSLQGEPLQIDEGGQSVTMSPSSDFAIEAIVGVQLDLQSGSGALRVEGPFAGSKLDSRYGDVEVDGLRGPLVASTSSGDLALRGLRGSVEATTAYGKVDARDLDGEFVRIETRSGDLDVEAVRSKQVRLHTRYGTVDVTDVHGDLDVQSSSGAIDVDEAKGALLCSTRYGDVRAKGVFTAVDANSASGSVTVRALPGSTCTSAWKAESGYGDVKVLVPDDFACELDAATRYGEAACELAVTMPAGASSKAKSLTGTVGRGGPQVVLRSKSGDVRLQRL